MLLKKYKITVEGFYKREYYIDGTYCEHCKYYSPINFPCCSRVQKLSHLTPQFDNQCAKDFERWTWTGASRSSFVYYPL